MEELEIRIYSDKIYLEPGHPDLTPELCAYREARIHRDFGFTLEHFVDLTLATPVSKIKQSMNSIEAIRALTLGLDGDKLEIDGCKDYCKEKCSIADCEYKPI